MRAQPEIPILTPEAIRARVLFRDRLMMVVDKPAGLPVHPGPGGGPTVEDWFPDLCFEQPRPPALAHRLDRDTSGCLVLGRSQKGLSRLGKAFQAGKVQKIYWAICVGAPEKPSGTIDAPLRKLTPKGGWRMVVDPKEGQKAVTVYRVLGHSPDGLTWVECRPRTGRTHQIRVHMAHLGAPLLGDPVYGAADPRGMHLHARAVILPPLKEGAEPVRVEAPPPPHMRAALEACGWRQDADSARSCDADSQNTSP